MLGRSGYLRKTFWFVLQYVAEERPGETGLLESVRGKAEAGLQ